MLFPDGYNNCLVVTSFSFYSLDYPGQTDTSITARPVKSLLTYNSNSAKIECLSMPPGYPDVCLKHTAPTNESGRTHSTRNINSFVRYVTLFKPART